MPPHRISSDINPTALITAAISVACVGITVYQSSQLRKLRAELDSLSSSAKEKRILDEHEQETTKSIHESLSTIAKGTTTKSIEAEKSESENTNIDDSFHGMYVHPIGKISSVYRLCVGTPRQGLLAPNSRGWIKLDRKRLAPDSLDQLHLYSHVWIVFVFHLNTNSQIVNAAMKSSSPMSVTSKIGKKKKGKGGHRLFPSKVSEFLVLMNYQFSYLLDYYF